MKKTALLAVVAFLTLTCSLRCAAQVNQDQGLWRADSSMARAITNDITIYSSKVTLDFYNFLIVRVRTLGPTEVAAAFDADVNAGRNGSLYRLTVPGATRFEHHNTLCSGEDTQWMATYVEGRTLQVAFFSGSNPPVFTMDALANTTDRCGTFMYSR
jgi:hypothetical protein